MDAGYKEDAARTCLNAISLARKKSPSQLVEVLKVQVMILYYTLCLHIRVHASYSL